MANEIDYCFAAVGVHPHHAEEFPDVKIIEEELIKIIEDDKKTTNRIVAIGECGLDYHEYSSPPDEVHNYEKQKNNQKDLLELHFRLAKKYNLPLIVHCRDAYTDLITLLQTTDYPASGGTGSLRTPPGVIHCFQGTLSDLKQFLELGFYVGYDGYITYDDEAQSAKRKSQNNYRELVLNTPLNRILTETDSPWLTPEPHRGTRNSPANIKIITKKIAEIKGMQFEEVDKITSDNANRLFFNSN